MNKTNLKRYAPLARKDFIGAVTARAQLLGLTEVAGQPYTEPCQVNGDVAVIAGRAWPASVQGKRNLLLQRIKRDGYAATLDAVAFTWFNRFAALRYMELHDYLGHGRRVLSNPDGALPEILNHALELAEAGDLPGLQAAQVRQLKLDNQDGELFRRVLIAQCNALHGAMPFLFEAIDDETELLLPDNLLLSDSVVTKLVSEIPEEDWSEVEVIGWLYQFYISEKKDQVIGKVVKSEDIPAATQLFTPNWIVQYLVQNSVGRLWLMANPDSTLASQWPYYIQPAEQTPEVQAQLDELIQARVREDGDTLNPETITVLDPACGSGHILVVAYDVLKAIYLERGYQPRAIPRLILEKNLYGLDIDDRAAQLASFALLMKARADDRRLFNDSPKLNVLSLQESNVLNTDELAMHLVPFGLQDASLKALANTFEHAKTFGSLIQIPPGLTGELAVMTAKLRKALQEGDLYAQQAAKDLLPFVWQALVLGMQFDAVVANPPYMGDKAQRPEVKSFIKKNFPLARADLYAAFIEQGRAYAKSGGFLSLVTMQTWMFLASYLGLRKSILSNGTISNLVHIGFNSFPELNSKIALASAVVIQNIHLGGYIGSYIDLNRAPPSCDKGALFDREASKRTYYANHDDFTAIPSNPIAYWVSDGVRVLFSDCDRMQLHADARQGMATTDNQRFLRFWFEISVSEIERGGSNPLSKWFPYNKGGEFRKWAGNHLHVVRYERDGEILLNLVRTKYPKISDPEFVIKNRKYYFLDGITWTDISLEISARVVPPGFIFDTAGPMAFFGNESDRNVCLAILNSKACGLLSSILNPTLHFTLGDFQNLPFLNEINSPKLHELVREAILLGYEDWDSSELSWDFKFDPLIVESRTIAESWGALSNLLNSRGQRLAEIETEINQSIIDAYNLSGEFEATVTIDEVTCLRPNREADSQRLVSYAVGCMMGRYSLDEPGVIYAHSSSDGFDPSRYITFPADSDGIVPITDELWFTDDTCSRIRDFLRAVWGADTLEENMAWLAESLGSKGSETPEETIRRYLADKFFKDHLQTYKKRPIHWLFSSGKQGAFKALVYLHRYHEGTLARMRSEYVLPLTGKMQARIESLDVDIRQASSTAVRNKLTKQVEALRKQHHELLAYDEKLRHYADQRISIDLDDGVKVNYGRLGDLLAEVKTVTGGAGDE
ncbi:BREX-1 system adenine-specific DNA-methyltransferase PglX [Achromobacter animicus]|uniref:BREX-1 system adenine-specific DNA-methyltransferase PglX n=1 Tax=Achromobacter animicus TaxID=1389935 RepID=UPI0028ACED15|nr:BREX-1 system adenine-specific DNA-methyltransferase PglX [Achromobacter animicus]